MNAIIVGADPGFWEEIEEIVQTALEPTVLTVRDEPIFRVTHQDPTAGVDWGNLRRFRQVLVIGTREDPWIAEAVERRPRGVPLDPPQMLQIDDVWAKGQVVTVLLLPEASPRSHLPSMMRPLQELLDGRFRAFARSRMFASGRDTVLAGSLLRDVGFSLVLPELYRYTTRDSVHRFRNDNPSPSELIREVNVTWSTPLPDTLPGPDGMFAWREGFVARYHTSPQLVEPAVVDFRELLLNGRRGVELQSAWMSPPDAWPAGGPFIVRAFACPEQDRLYRIDAWLYAPGRAKYEYMIQLQTILDSFTCR